MKKSPTDPTLIEQLGQAQAQRAAAGQLRDTTAAAHPNSLPVQNAAADAAVKMQDWRAALNYGHKSVDLAGNDPAKLPGALDDLSLAQLKTGDYKDAALNAKRALDLNPADAQVAYDLNATYHDATAQLAGQAASAKTGSAAKKLAADLAEPDLSPGGTRATTNDDSRFKATAQNIAALSRLKDAQSALDMGDAEGALRAAQAAEVASPAFTGDARVMEAQAWSVLKNLSQAVAKISEAIEFFEKQQGRKADLARAYSQRAAFQNDLDRPGDAVTDADSALKNDPKLATAYYERARADEALGKTDAAGADIDQAALLDASFMADRDEFHKRHRGALSAEAAPTAPLWSRLAAAAGGGGRIAVGVLGAAFVLFAGYVALFAKESSPVHLARFTRRSTTPDPAQNAPPPLPIPEIGALLAGQYRIVKKIGEGGMGTVYEGYDTRLKRPVAIKRLRPELQSSPRERERFVQEAELVASLQHPHTVQIYTILHDDQDTHIVFELIDGRTLHDVLNESPERHLGTRRALELLDQIAQAVDHAHGRRVIHRDLKPSNVMIDARGWAKVMDFGIARHVQDVLSDTMTGTVVGTPPYMAPEQLRGEVTKQSDIFALGVIFYETLTGRLPFSGDNAPLKAERRRGRFSPPSRLVPGLPSALDAVLEKALDADPRLRYASGAELHAAAVAALGQATPSV